MGKHLNILATEGQDKIALVHDGKLIYNGPNINGEKLNELLETLVGTVKYIDYHVVTEAQMDDPIKAMYQEF